MLSVCVLCCVRRVLQKRVFTRVDNAETGNPCLPCHPPSCVCFLVVKVELSSLQRSSTSHVCSTPPPACISLSRRSDKGRTRNFPFFAFSVAVITQYDKRVLLQTYFVSFSCVIADTGNRSSSRVLLQTYLFCSRRHVMTVEVAPHLRAVKENRETYAT